MELRQIDNGCTCSKRDDSFSSNLIPIPDILDLLIALSNPSSMFIIHGHKMSSAFVLHMRLCTLIDLIDRKELFYG